MSFIRTKNVLLGLAAGDSLSWQAMYNQSTQYPYWTRRLRREIDANAEKDNILKLNLPFSLNNQADLFKLSPTDDTEWAAFTAEIILKNNGEYIFDSHVKEWQYLASVREEIKGSISITGALKNLSGGLMPPQSGNDNPHYFDDSAMVRAAVIGALYPGDILLAADHTAQDAAITNSLDGLWAAKAFAAAVSTACVNESINSIISSALDQIPGQSWVSLKVKEALAIAERFGNTFEAVPVIHDNIIDYYYNYGSSAPDNLALTLSLFHLNKGDLFSGVTAALSLAKTADSVPAFTGALCGALRVSEMPVTWLNSLSFLRGICIPHMKGKNLIDIAVNLNKFAVRRINDQKEFS